MPGKYNPAKKLTARFPRYPERQWVKANGRAMLTCGCGQVLFFVHKTGMERQRHTREASHRKVVAVCPNPKCKQEIRLD